MQANEAPQERMSAAWRLHKRGYEPRRGSVMVKTIDATTTDRLRRSPLYSDLSPSCARKRACMELTTICRFQRLKIPLFDFFSAFAKGMSLCYGVIVLGDLIHLPFLFWKGVFAPILAKFLVSLHPKIRMKLDNELLMNLLAVTFGKS